MRTFQESKRPACASSITLATFYHPRNYLVGMEGVMNAEGPLGILIVHMLVNNRFKEGEGAFYRFGDNNR